MTATTSEVLDVTAAEILDHDPLLFEPGGLAEWSTRPLTITEQTTSNGAEYRLHWPGSDLVGQSLTDFLNVSAPNSDYPVGARDDFRLLTEPSSFPDGLWERHRDSFGPLWDAHYPFAVRAHDALSYLKLRHYFQHGNDTYYSVPATLVSQERHRQQFDAAAELFPYRPLLELLERYGLEQPSAINSDVLRAGETTPEFSVCVSEGNYRSILYAKLGRGLVQELRAHIPDLDEELYAVLMQDPNIVVFDPPAKYGLPTMIADGDSLTPARDIIEAFDDNVPVRHLDREVESFDYIPFQGNKFIIIEDSYRIRDPRPHLQPTLVWHTGHDGERTVQYNAPPITTAVNNENRSYDRVIDPMLGALIPFMLSPQYRADTTNWPERFFLPADLDESMTIQEAARLAEQGLLRVRFNDIGPANVTMLALIKLAKAPEIFPFDKFERHATPI